MHLFYLVLFAAVAYSAKISFSGQLADVSCGKNSAGTCATPPQYTILGLGASGECAVGTKSTSWVSMELSVATSGFYYVTVHASSYLLKHINVGFYADSFDCAASCDNLVWALHGEIQSNPAATSIGAIWLPAGTIIGIVTHDDSIKKPQTGFEGVFVVELTKQPEYQALVELDRNSVLRGFTGFVSPIRSATFTWTPPATANYTLGFTGIVANSNNGTTHFTKSIGFLVGELIEPVRTPFGIEAYADYVGPCMDNTNCGTKITKTTIISSDVWELESGTEYTFVFGMEYNELLAGVLVQEYVPAAEPPLNPVAPTNCTNPMRLGDTQYARVSTPDGNVTTECSDDGPMGSWNAVPIDVTTTGYTIVSPFSNVIVPDGCNMIDKLVLTLFNESVAPEAYSMRNFDTLPPDCSAGSFVKAGENIPIAAFLVQGEQYTMVVTASEPTEAIEDAVFSWQSISGSPVGCFPEIVPVPTMPTQEPIEPTTPQATSPPSSPASIKAFVLSALISLFALVML